MGGGRGSMEARILLWYHIEVDQNDQVRAHAQRANKHGHHRFSPVTKNVFFPHMYTSCVSISSRLLTSLALLPPPIAHFICVRV